MLRDGVIATEIDNSDGEIHCDVVTEPNTAQRERLMGGEIVDLLPMTLGEGLSVRTGANPAVLRLIRAS